jgi:Prp8 binding protein
LYELQGHQDTPVGIRLSPDGNSLLSNSLDNTVRIWDVKPFSAISGRCMATLHGAPHDFSQNLIRPCWSPQGRYVACGAGDRTVVVWDVFSQKILYKLPGHKGTVTDVDWHVSEPILASGSIDGDLFLGELDVNE